MVSDLTTSYLCTSFSPLCFPVIEAHSRLSSSRAQVSNRLLGRTLHATGCSADPAKAGKLVTLETSMQKSTANINKKSETFTSITPKDEKTFHDSTIRQYATRPT